VEIIWKFGPHRLKRLGLEESLARVLRPQHGHVRTMEEFPRSDREVERAAQRGELTVDRGVGCAFLLPARDVGANVVGGDFLRAPAGKLLSEMCQVPIDARDCAQA